MEEKIKYVICWVFGIMTVGFSIWHCELGHVSGNQELAILFLTFGLAIVMKLLVNQYVEVSRSVIIDIMSTTSLLKVFVLLLYIYLFLGLRKREINLERFVLEYMVLNTVGLSTILYQGYYEAYKSFDIKILIFSAAIGIMCCRGIRIEYIKYCEMGLITVNLIIEFVLYFLYKKKGEKVLGEARFWIELCLKFLMIQAIFFMFVYQNIHRYVAVAVAFHFIRTVFIFCFTYRSCMLETWRSRVHQLNEAELMIAQQKENCNMIVNLSHELKTPINIIRSALELLSLEYEKNKELLSVIERVKGQCNQVMNIIQDMIEIQKIKGHYIQEKYQIYNVVEVVENVVEAFCEEIPECQIVFNPLEEEIYQEIDIERMQQSLILFIGCLLKASGDELYIEMGIQEKGEIYIRFKHPKVTKIWEMFEAAKKEKQEKVEIADTITLKLIEYLIQGQKGKMSYEEFEESTEMKITFPSCLLTAENWLDPLNLIYLKDQVKARDIRVSAINMQ